MQSKAAIMGHPIHPMLVGVPVGLFAWTLVADIVFGIRQEQGWYDIAFWSGIAAWISGLAVALPGIADYLMVARKTDAMRIGATHAVLMVATVACYFIAMFLMNNNDAFDLGGRYQTALGLHAFGTLAVLVSGWLGGEMVFRHHIGVIPGHDEAEPPVSIHHRAA